MRRFQRLGRTPRLGVSSAGGGNSLNDDWPWVRWARKRESKGKEKERRDRGWPATCTDLSGQFKKNFRFEKLLPYLMNFNNCPNLQKLFARKSLSILYFDPKNLKIYQLIARGK